MTWIVSGVLLALFLACVARVQHDRRARDRVAPPAFQRRGVRHLGEAPVRVHHRMGRL